ncbi:hypothetical protein ABT364_24110 [Massilia sp. SR12]
MSARPVSATAVAVPQEAKSFQAQVVGLQWLNPLQRRDYPTEWQLLWTLGLAQPNKDDDMVKLKPEKYSKLQAIGIIASGNDGAETFKGYHHKYVEALTELYHDIYFSSSTYFYNAHSLTDKKTWRELAGIHIEYAIPEGRLDPVEAGNYLRDDLVGTFNIGNKAIPKAWSRATPPDVRVTTGGANAGFISLAAGLDYLQSHPNETVWVMNWDAPSFPPKSGQINENMVLLVKKQTFNTPALLGEMGAGTALTNVALGIAYANHIGKHVLVAGTTDSDQPTAVVVSPPAKVRPIDPNAPWFRARGGGSAFLPWWGLRHDAKPASQGYSR